MRFFYCNRALNVDNVIGNETNIDSKVSMPAVHDVFIHDGRALPADSNQILKFGAEKEYVAGLDNLLGKGTFGKVYRALDTNTGRHVAVKTERADLDKPTLPREYQNYQTIGPHRELHFGWIVFYHILIGFFLLAFSRWHSRHLLFRQNGRWEFIRASYAIARKVARATAGSS